MCIFRAPKPPEPPAPLPPAPVPPAPPAPPAPVPEPTVKPVNLAIREAQSKLGTKKGKKGSTADLRIEKQKQQVSSGTQGSINTGNTSTTGGIQ